VSGRAQRLATRLVRAAVAAPARAFVVSSLVVGLAVLSATQLAGGSPERLLARSDSRAGAATIAQERSFGAEPVVVDVVGPVQRTLTPANLTRLLAVESRLRRLAGVQTVFGPGTFVDQAVGQMNRVVVEELGPAAERADLIARKAVQLAKARGLAPDQYPLVAEAARLRALGPLRRQYESLLVRFGSIGFPSLTNTNFVLQLVMGASQAPKPRFAWLFPDSGHALVVVRLRDGLPDAQVRTLGGRIAALAAAAGLRGVRAEVAGAPLVIARASAEVNSDLLRLLPLVVAAMLLVLMIGLGWRARAIHLLAPAGAAAITTAGLSWPLGLGLTPATLAALPVIVGLAVDYAVQLQVRYWRARRDRAMPRAAAMIAVRQIAPTLLLAGAAMIAGFLVLALSPVPLVDRLGVTLAVGVASALAFVLVLGPPLMAACDRPGVKPPRLALRGVALPYRVRMAALGVVLGAALAGIVLSSGVHLESDLRKLADPRMAELGHLEGLQRQLGTSGQLRIAITAGDVTDPGVLRWMAAVEPRILALDRGLRAGPNLAQIIGEDGAGIPDRASVQRLLHLIPSTFVAAVLTPDHRRAELSFGVPLASASTQAQLIARVQNVLDSTRPGGVDARVAGLLAVSAAGVAGLQDERPWMLLGALLVVFLLLLAVRRDVRRAAIPLVPAALAAGLTALVIRVIGLHLSPLSAGLDPLVLAVGAEFGVLLEARYHEERALGGPRAHAAAVARRESGAAVLVAAATVALGFVVLAASRIPVLRQFGLLAALELALCVVAALILVPSLAAVADRGRSPSRRPERGPRVVHRVANALHRA
jgi:hydrophobe/amphiphile efflux-3 (HAE3) family protein